MAKGITEHDVWTAADTLLLEGARPTIERVRLKIGRGSPNTVSPHLETWFAHLGARIADPRAFSAPPDVPDPVLQAARHFWETAMAQARQIGAEQIAQAQAEAQARIEAAESARAMAEDALRRATERAHAAESALDQLRLAHAGAQAAHAERLQALQREIDQRAQREAALAEQLRTQQERHHVDLAAATERAVQAERRAAADMDRERQARARAEQLARDTRQQMDHALETERQRAQAELVAQVQAHTRQEARNAVLRDRVAELEGELVAARLERKAERRVGPRDKPVSTRPVFRR